MKSIWVAACAAAVFSASGTAAREMEEVRVTGRAQELYRANDSSLATKTPTDIMDIPQSIQILPRQLIEDQAARQITDLYRSIAGISFFSYSGVTFRGFRQDVVFYDGVRGDPFGGFDIPQLFNIERVEVLKGPAGTLYGSGEPGGLINYVTKRPSAEAGARFVGILGNFDLYGGSAELTGALDGAGKIAYRLGAFYKNEDHFRANATAENAIFDGGLSFALGSRTDLLLQATYLDQDLGAHRIRGVPVDDEGEFITSIRWNHNEPTDFQRLEAKVLQGRLEHQFTDGLSGDVTLRWLENEQLQNYHEPRGLVDSDGDGVFDTSRREFRDQFRSNQEISVTANLVWQTALAGMGHTLLVGGDWFSQDSHFNARTATSTAQGGPVPDLSLFDPVYGLTSAADYGLDGIPRRFTDDNAKRWGVYIQDQVELSPAWQILLGARFDKFSDQNVLTGQRFKDDDVTLRGGVVYKPVEDLSLYASYSEGFLPQSVASQDEMAGGPFGPESNRQYEAGVKSVLWDGRVRAEFAVYEIERRGILQGDPQGDRDGDGVDDMVALGKVRSRGFEVQMVGDIAENWVLTANYAFNKVKILDSNGRDDLVNAVGGRFANAPKHSFGLWTRYDLPVIRSAIAFGADYVSRRISLDGQTVDPYVIFDASWQTHWRNLVFQINVDNLFDKEYAASGFIQRTGHFPGEPRRVEFQVKADF